MNKEKILRVATEGIIISQVKLEILNIIKKFKSDEYLDENKIINAINAVPIRYFESLFEVANQTSIYKERIRNIVNMVLKKIS